MFGSQSIIINNNILIYNILLCIILYNIKIVVISSKYSDMRSFEKCSSCNINDVCTIIITI